MSDQPPKKPSKEQLEQHRKSRQRNRQRHRLLSAHMLAQRRAVSPVIPPLDQQYMSTENSDQVWRMPRFEPNNVDPDLLQHQRYNRCIICLEGTESGDLIYPCNCRGEMGRYHYMCLWQQIEETGDDHCTRCHTRFRDRRIQSFIQTPSIRQFLRDRLFYPDHEDPAILDPFLLLMAIIDIFHSIFMFILNGEFVFPMEAFITVVLIPLIRSRISYDRYYRAHNYRMIRFTGLEGYPSEYVMNLSKRRAQISWEEQLREQRLRDYQDRQISYQNSILGKSRQSFNDRQLSQNRTGGLHNHMTGLRERTHAMQTEPAIQPQTLIGPPDQQQPEHIESEHIDEEQQPDSDWSLD